MYICIYIIYMYICPHFYQRIPAWNLIENLQNGHFQILKSISFSREFSLAEGVKLRTFKSSTRGGAKVLLFKATVAGFGGKIDGSYQQLVFQVVS